eukprot:1149052-Pelagomonas_calceolata.AAC.1
MPGVNNGCRVLDSMAQIDKRFDRVLIGLVSWTKFHFNKVNVPVLRRDLGRIKVSLSAWDRAHKDSIRATLVPGREASTVREKPV